MLKQSQKITHFQDLVPILLHNLLRCGAAIHSDYAETAQALHFIAQVNAILPFAENERMSPVFVGHPAAKEPSPEFCAKNTGGSKVIFCVVVSAFCSIAVILHKVNGFGRAV